MTENKSGAIVGTLETFRDISGDSAGPSGTVLLVDDNETILEVASLMLESLGYRVLTADTGRRAVEIYQNPPCRIDLVLLDMTMPEMDGAEVYHRLKARDPLLKALLVSGYGKDCKISDILRQGCNDFIQKPFDLKGLSEKIQGILGR